MSISASDIDIVHTVNFRYFHNDECIHQLRFTGLGDLLIADNHQIGDHIQLKTLEAQYKKKTLEEKLEEEAKQKNSDWSSISKIVGASVFATKKPSFFSKVAHSIKEDMKEQKSKVEVTRIYRITSLIHDINAFTNNQKTVNYYLELVNEFVG